MAPAAVNSYVWCPRNSIWFRLIGMTGWTLLLAALVFVAVPRLGFNLIGWEVARWRSGGSGTRRSVGFNETVKLGDLGFVIQDPDKVLDVEFLDHATGDPYPVDGEIYVRGAVLARYYSGSWKQAPQTERTNFAPQRFRKLPSTAKLVRQEIEIEPMDRKEVFCVWPVVALPQTQGVSLDYTGQKLERASSQQGRRFAYSLGTTAFIDGKQAQFIPAETYVNANLLIGIPNDLPKLVQQAQTWIDESGIPESDPIGRAQVLESQFRDSGAFRYQLGGISRDSNIDPIEDFIANNRAGHCEYFATALTLMLRAQGIPARMIVGFKPSGFEAAQNSFTVRQWDAHTWVEAYISPEQVRRREELPGGAVGAREFGGWLRLDPTTSAPESTGIAALVEGARNWREWLASAWRDNVIGMDGRRQRELVYDPLMAAAKSSAGCLVDPDWWKGLFDKLMRLPGWLRESLAGGRWFSWRGGLVAMILAALCYAGYRAARLVARLVWLRLIGRTVGRSQRRRASIRFYRRLEAIMKRHGLNRLPGQTHREFAAQARREMAQSAEVGDLANLPGEITEAFYGVRFGGAALDSRRAQTVEHALGRLEKSGTW